MYLQKLLKRIALILFATIILVYSGYKLTPIIRGPEITIISTDSQSLEGLIMVKGVAKRVKELRIFDKVLDMTEMGEFSTNIVKNEPYTNIIIRGTDKWGKEKVIKINVK
jgi:hypothetical protein